MISVYSWVTAADYSKLGDAVLQPSRCITHQVGGGQYTVQMTHPIDEQGKYKYLINGNILKVPVPQEEIENAYSGQDMWIYYTAEETTLRQTPVDPQPISYAAWSDATDYTVGDKVSYLGRNYQCTYFDMGSGQRFVPPNNSPWWRQIASQTDGGTVVASLPAGTKLIWVSGSYSDTWWEMSTFGGVEGWIKQADLTGEEHREKEDVGPIRIKDQLFRIKKVTKQTNEEILVEAEHVSYDAAGYVIKKAEMHQVTPAMAIWMMQEALFEPYEAGIISTNLTGTDAGTYTQTIKGKNLIYGLLDPSSGIVAKFGAALKRNNWDIYILEKQDTDRGYTIRYGVNAVGISWERDVYDVITRIVPVAKNEKGEELYLPETYVDSPLKNLYPVQRTEQINVNGQVGKDDGSGTDTVWTEEALFDEMRAKAQERFDNEKADLEKVTVTVDFVMLGDTEEYAYLKPLESVVMYDIVHAVNDMYGLDIALRVVEIEWDALQERIIGIKLSNVSDKAQKSVSGYMMTNQSVTMDKLEMQTMTEIVEAAADRAVSILK